MKNIWNQ